MSLLSLSITWFIRMSRRNIVNFVHDVLTEQLRLSRNTSASDQAAIGAGNWSGPGLEKDVKPRKGRAYFFPPKKDNMDGCTFVHQKKKILAQKRYETKLRLVMSDNIQEVPLRHRHAGQNPPTSVGPSTHPLFIVPWPMCAMCLGTFFLRTREVVYTSQCRCVLAGGIPLHPIWWCFGLFWADLFLVSPSSFPDMLRENLMIHFQHEFK